MLLACRGLAPLGLIPVDGVRTSTVLRYQGADHGRPRNDISHQPLPCAHRRQRHPRFAALHLDPDDFHPVTVKIAAQHLDRATGVERGVQEGQKRITMQDSLDTGRGTGDGVGDDVTGANDQIHRGFLPCSAPALTARSCFVTPCDAVFRVTGPRGDLWDRLSTYSWTRIPNRGELSPQKQIADR